MKIHLCILGIISVLVLVTCETSDVKKDFKECAKEAGLPAEPPKEKLNFDDPKFKCFQACIMKKKGEMVDGKVDAPQMIELSEKQSQGKITDSMKADVTECAGKANEEKDECEVASAFIKCIMDKHPPPKQ